MYTVMVQGAEFQVCRKAFYSIHNVSEKCLHNALKKMTATGTLVPDMRGKHTPPNRISDESRQSV